MGASVNRKDGKFKMSNLVPGGYTVRIYTPGNNSSNSYLIADPFEVMNQNIKDLVLLPKVEARPKPKPKPKKKNEKKR